MSWALLRDPRAAARGDAALAASTAGVSPGRDARGRRSRRSRWRSRSRSPSRTARVRRRVGGGCALDSLGAVFLLATGLLYAVAGGLLGRLPRAPSGHAPASRAYARRYYALLNLFGWTMLLVPLTADFGTLWVAVELTTIVSALLVAIDRTDAALEAAWKYVLIASVGLGIALLAIIVLYAAGTHALGDAYLPRFARLLAHAHGLSPDAVQLAFVLAVVGFGTKVGFVPMHTWLPDAHSEAPAPVSALLSGALLADAFYAILRFFQVAVAAGERVVPEHVLLVFGAVSLIAAAVRAAPGELQAAARLLVDRAHGVIALGIGFGAPLAVAGALLHVINHAAAKGLAFFGSRVAAAPLRHQGDRRVRGAGTRDAVERADVPRRRARALRACRSPASSAASSRSSAAASRSPQYVWRRAAARVRQRRVLRRRLARRAGWCSTPASAPAPAVRRRASERWMVAGDARLPVVVVGLGLHVPGDLVGAAAARRRIARRRRR